MKKKVRFSDKLDVFYTGVSLKEHIQEIKNPSVSIVNKIPKKSTSGYTSTKKGNKINSGKSSSWTSWIFWLIIAVVAIISTYFLWRFFFKEKSLNSGEIFSRSRKTEYDFDEGDENKYIKKTEKESWL